MDQVSLKDAHTRLGQYITISVADEAVQAFIPSLLPPTPPLQLTNEDYELLEKANRALGRLDGITAVLPNTRH